jgi:regulator of protease activity HflC (stomatin/prohibitin superfamily)
VSEATTQPDGPVVQSVSIGFRVLYVAIAALFCAWIGSNWRPVPADSQAVVLLFGRITGVQQAGLTVSWPRPVGDVVLLPGPDRLLTVQSDTTARLGGLQDAYTDANGVAVPPGTGSYLTGDGGVVLLSATIAYQVNDGAAYYLAGPHVEPALRRLFDASAVTVAATHGLDDFLVARPDRARAEADLSLEARRQALRGDIVREMNRRLAELAGRNGSIGVAVRRIDLVATLPPAAKIAFDQVTEAIQIAERTIAGARTEATRISQAADRERDQLLTAAHASAEERVGEARTRTASIAAIQHAMTHTTRDAMLDQLYRDQLALVVHKVGRLTAVDARGGARVILPATLPGASQ